MEPAKGQFKERLYLREAVRRIEQVKAYACDRFGFYQSEVSPDWTVDDPAEGCGFSVKGVSYEACGGRIAVASQGEGR